MFNNQMTHLDTEKASRETFLPWTEPLFLAGVGSTLLAIIVYESSNWVYGPGPALRLTGIALSIIGGVILATWALRRREVGKRRNGAFALTCSIFSLLGAGAAFFIEQAVQHAMSLAVFGPLATLTMTLAALGLITFVGGIVKRINA